MFEYIFMRYNAYQKLNHHLFIIIIKTTKFHTEVTVQKIKKNYVSKTNITKSITSNMNVKIEKKNNIPK